MLRELLHDAVHGVMIPMAAWLWNERRILKEVAEGTLERRHAMGKYLKLVPLLEKLATDLEAAAQSPQDQAVVADIKALIADIGVAPPTA